MTSFGDGKYAYIRLDSAKVNVAPNSQKATWFKLVSVKLNNGTMQYPNGDEVQAVGSNAAREHPPYPPSLTEWRT
jgi:hypothetical protein